MQHNIKLHKIVTEALQPEQNRDSALKMYYEMDILKSFCINVDGKSVYL